MYYLLNFYDHTFATMHTDAEILSALEKAQSDGKDLSYFEVVNCFDADIRTDGQSFFSEHFANIMSEMTRK